ncbi:MAG: hypothetical protein VW907_10425 [Opitutae bacterium]|jgi:hypothetical protein
MKFLVSLIVAVTTITALGVILWYTMPGFRAGLQPAKIIQVKAYLDNRCSLGDDAFVMYAPKQERTARFYDRIATMRLPENATVQLAMSAAYPNFKYDDVPVKVAPEVTLIADCSASPRLKSVFDSMNKQFKNN